MKSFFFGVLFPIIVLGVELTTRLCTGAFFDPIPTIWHVLFVAFVALGNLMVLCVLAVPTYKPTTKDALVIGAVIGISFIYTLRFLPLLPVAVIFSMMWGMGLLILGPLSSFIVAVLLARRIWFVDVSVKEKVKAPGMSQRIIAGIMIGVVAIFLVEMPHTITRQALKQAVSNDARESRSGINMLRSFGSQSELLKFCYADKMQMADFPLIFTGQLLPISTDDARKVYYRISGIPFNLNQKPDSLFRLFGGDPFTDFWGFRNWDSDLAGESVGGRVDQLALKHSDLVISADPDSASADLEWTFVFENNSNSNAEARTKIDLPPGATVSDLTLWIKGQPQKAAFSSRSRVRRAYQSIVSRSRDPVLVTTAGTDRVMLQCFPVPSHGTMKTQIRIAAPLRLEKDRATLLMPKLVENNFDIGGSLNTTVNSNRPLLSKPVSLIEKNASGTYSAKGAIDRNQVTASIEPLVFERNPKAPDVSKLFTVGKDSKLLTQKIVEVKRAPIENVVLVVDGSNSMKAHATEVSEAMASISANLPWSVVLAADEISMLTPEDKLYQTLTPQVVASKLNNLRFEGGPDNATALMAAVKLAESKPNTRILWIHGPQPVIFQDPARLFADYKGPRPVIYSLEVEPGPNLIAEKFVNYATIKNVPRFGKVKEDLSRILREFDSGAVVYLPSRTVVDLKAGASPSSGDSKGHDELIKLWASDAVYEHINEHVKDHGDEKVTGIATTYRVVTPVSGAVVLETAQDYARNGLKQGDASQKKGKQGEPVFTEEADVPSAPEPEMWFLLFVVGMMVILQNKRVQRLLPWRN